MKIHRDNNNNSTCLKELAGFEGGGGAMECLVHAGEGISLAGISGRQTDDDGG